FPDFHNRVEELVPEGERVVARLTYTGTHAGELLGIAPTGRRVNYAGVALFRIASGQIADRSSTERGCGTDPGALASPRRSARRRRRFRQRGGRQVRCRRMTRWQHFRALANRHVHVRWTTPTPLPREPPGAGGYKAHYTKRLT